MEKKYLKQDPKSISVMHQQKMQLQEADVKYLRKFDKDFMPEKWYWGFSCFSRENYKNHICHEFEDQIIYGIYSYDGGCMAEMTMTWGNLRVKEPYLRCFSESFFLIMSPMHKNIFAHIRKWNKEWFSAEDFSKLLISLGFQDDSDFPLE